MHTHNETTVGAPLETCFEVAADVERWPEILPHYDEVRFLRREGFGRGRVRMAADREFGPFAWPTWWESEMAVDRGAAVIRYHHVKGITRGMDVEWRFSERPGAAAEGRRAAPETRIVVLHDWKGPSWPVIGGLAARRVIGPHFIHFIADRTLDGVRREAERRAGTGPDGGRVRPLDRATAGPDDATAGPDDATAGHDDATAGPDA